jgi:Flp pilus assembly protein TadG
MCQGRSGGDERGSVAAELTLLVPALVVLLLFVVFCGRLAEARLRVEDAAHQAARAATLARSLGQADADARDTAQAALDRAGMSCRTLSVDTRLGGLRPGGMVRVRVTCQVGVSDLALLAVPATVRVSADADSIVDRWRGGPLSPGGDAR